jgi:hypothetical protein
MSTEFTGSLTCEAPFFIVFQQLQHKFYAKHAVGAET